MTRLADHQYLNKDFLLRTLTIVVGAPLFLLVLYTGGLPWLLAVLLGTGIASHEFYGLVRHAGYQAYATIGIVSALALVIAGAIQPPLALAVLVVVMLTTPLWLTGSREPIGRDFFVGWTGTVAGLVYVAGLMVHAVWLRALPAGLPWLVMAVLATWGTDIGAYLVGRFLGQHQFSPLISPKKTWEGTIGGVLIGWTVAFLTARFFQVPVTHAAILGLLIPIVAVLGDLVESAIKRASGAKDAGRLLPGHGGVLDRFDSLMFVVPVVYYYVLFFLQR